MNFSVVIVWMVVATFMAPQLTNALQPMTRSAQLVHRSSTPLYSTQSVIEAREERRAWRLNKRKEVLKFAGPALSTVLADPVMSVIDALCVGRFCSTVQLASLGPALAVFNFVSYFFFFLNAATCVLVTQAVAMKDNEGAKDVLSNALALAVSSGITLGAFMLYFADPLIALTGCIKDLRGPAAAYLKVRAVGLPVVLATMVANSALLGQLDTTTPLQCILLASFLNTVGDLWLVPIMGAPGAALATLVSQLAAFPVLLYLNKMRKRVPIVLKRPEVWQLQDFFTTAGPLFFFEAGMSVCYLIIESLSTRFGVMSAAAFRALWSPLAVLGFFTYPLKQAAQVYLPKILSEPKESSTIGGKTKIKEFIKVLATLSTVSGIGLSVISIILTRNPQLFTADKDLWPMMKSFQPYVATVLPILGIAQVLEGVLIGSDDLSALSLAQIGNISVCALVLYCTNKANMGIYGTWAVYAAFLISRTLQSALRVFSLKKPWEHQADPHTLKESE